uniref:Uncharacterized protein n=1 Tax=Bionectria ochroleuca TaxID=29856 RepID=A0A0B7KIC6_BIOOC
MADSKTQTAMASKNLLLFGPGALTLDEAYYNRILSFMKGKSKSQWALDAIDDIGNYWESVCELIPKLEQVSGMSDAQRLADWIRKGIIPSKSTVSNLPNSILGPLVIISQLVEYIQYITSSSKSSHNETNKFHKPSKTNTETVGCCLGVFSALVVSSSSSWRQFHHNASAVLRTVFILGALSDLQDTDDKSGPSVSLIAFWRGGRSLSDLEKALEKHPEAYVSVLYDENRVTVTASTRTVSDLKRSLQAIGITANETEFHGRFHAGKLYKEELEKFFNFCNRFPAFQLPDASCLIVPTRINADTTLSKPGNLLEAASRAFLVEQFNWIKTFRAVVSSSLQDRNSRVIEFGPEKCAPPTLLRRLNSQINHFDLEQSIASPINGTISSSLDFKSADNDIAVIGMSCSVAGATDLEQFWKILLEGKSQHRKLVPNDRFVMETIFRQHEKGDEKKPWFGNFLDDQDTFDSKFFKKSPREALHMDPQQRLILQAAYRAVAQSGYYNKPESDSRVGCYIGLVANDYENNIACTAPTAFSATGALRSYVSGKVSHFFGWTGPGMTIDTACSASTVAIDLACRAILSGDCSAALAGGTNLYTTPMFFQNLAAGSFLSPTGQCKPFDANADGYCRGEAIGAVFLKKLSNAIADGDQIMGVISSTAINQNDNSTPIFVPNPKSLTEVFKKVISKSGLEAKNISVVEAHGTGTPVGDPVEYDSIRQVLGRATRVGLDPLQVGSVKGLIGHTEGASGVIALIKILLMMNEGFIPPQASFTTISPSIRASDMDNMAIARAPLPWKETLKAALINNYGAAGSNASMVIKQAPTLGLEHGDGGQKGNVLSSPMAPFKCPFYIGGLDEQAIRRYAAELREFIKRKTISGDRLGIENLAFNVNRQSNWSLRHAMVFSSDSVEGLDEALASFGSFTRPSARPTILCFGGQVSKFVGLAREVFDKAAVLRKHLDHCDDVCKSINAGSIYPGIFGREPIDDPSVLQPLLFAMQYSSAMSWIECGIKPATLVGHSFGELTALCVSGILNLEDALKIIYGRAKIIRDSWGSEKGSMIAVEADLDVVINLLAASNASLPDPEGTGRATIACFNGPRSFTLAGSMVAMDAVEENISSNRTKAPISKYKRLDVTNAFHSPLVEKLKPELESLVQTVVLNPPEIRMETATEKPTTDLISVSYVVEHMRRPVYFNQAVQRIAKEYPEAVWLEAGSNSTITTMANKALGMPKGATFQPVNVTSGNQALQNLVDTTMTLWKAGLQVTFWPHSRLQTYEYRPIFLPSYQFDKQRYWLDFKPPPKQVINQDVAEQVNGPSAELPPTGLYIFLGYTDDSENKCQFRLNTGAKPYLKAMSDHVLLKTQKTCPTTFEIDVAVQAITSIRPELSQEANLQPQIHNITNQYPNFDSSRAIFIYFERLSRGVNSWNFTFTSTLTGSPDIVHLSGQLCFLPLDDQRSCLEFSRLERLVTHSRCLKVLRSDDEAEEVIQGRSIYKVLSDIIDYGEQLRSLTKLVGRLDESAGRIVGSIWANSMAHDRRTPLGTVYVCCSIEQWVRSPSVLRKIRDGAYRDGVQQEWQVLAQHKRANSPESSYITDMFVFDALSGSLEEAILGMLFTPLELNQSTENPSSFQIAAPVADKFVLPLAATAPTIHPSANGFESPQTAMKPAKRVVRQKKNTKDEIWVKLQPVLADISGLAPEEINQTDSLADIGIDSLMGMEMAREVETTFKCTLEQSQLVTLVDIPGILIFLQSVLGDGDEDGVGYSDSSEAAYSEASVPSSHDDIASISSSDQLEACGKSEAALRLPTSVILEAFKESKSHTDQFLKAYGCAGYLDGVSQKQTRLCLVLTSEAFKKLGCDLEAAKPGEVLQPVPFISKHKRFHEYLYGMLEETRIIDIDGDIITRTAIPLPSQSAEAILENLMRHHADNGSSHQLTYNVGTKMADVLSGKADGPQLIFGDAKNRELVASFYGELPFNRLYFEQMVEFLTLLATRLKLSSHNQHPLRILEMGAGTGGTTKVIVPALAKLGIPVEYTFTDLSPSLVAQAKRKFKQYSFMKFAVHDIEQPPSDPELMGSQHLVIASNAVHATHSLRASAENIRKFLRPDGFVMLLEMMGTLHWVDVVWGTLEGWWLFDDGRRHAIVNEQRWEMELKNAGYKHVDWTDGKLPENHVQRVVIAMVADAEKDLETSSRTGESLPTASNDHGLSRDDIESRKSAADRYVQSAADGFLIPEYNGPPLEFTTTKCVLVTGGTGSLGSHIISHLLSLPTVDFVYCLNRHASRIKDAPIRSPLRRQMDSFESKGIKLNEGQLAKLKVFESDSSKPQLGMPADEYDQLLRNVTHLVHNAFPVNGMRSLPQNEPQFATMRNLVDMAAAVSARRKTGARNGFKLTFQFISSLSAVGMYPIVNNGEIDVPEKELDIDCALPNGYGGGKVICERLLFETLGRYPDRFKAMTTRLGQLSGSIETGYWNHMEVLGFLFKSAQTLKAFPDVKGVISWLALEDASASLAELLLREDPECHRIYHVDNPSRRTWEDMLPVLTETLGVPSRGVIPLREWLKRVQAYPGENPWDNPAAKAMDFFDHKFEHMSCGGVTMSTDHAREHSSTLRAVQPVSDGLVRKYIQGWKDSGFLR